METQGPITTLTETTNNQSLGNNPSPICPAFPWNPSQCDVVIAVRKTASAISLILVIFVIFIIWLYRMYTRLPQRLVLNLCIACILQSAISFFPYRQSSAWCVAKGFMLNYSLWATLMWILCINLNMFLVGIKEKNTDHFEWIYHLVCWLVPLAVSLLPFISNMYGPAGVWCWIRRDHSGSVWRIAIWYGPLYVGIVALFVSSIYIIVRVRYEFRRYAGHYDPQAVQKRAFMKENVKSMIGYPFAFLLTSIFPLIHRIYNAAVSQDSFPLMLLHSISLPFLGALYAGVFVLHGSVRKRLKPSGMKRQLILRIESCKSKTVIKEYDTSVSTPPAEGVSSDNRFSEAFGTGPEASRTTAVTTAVVIEEHERISATSRKDTSTKQGNDQSAYAVRSHSGAGARSSEEVSEIGQEDIRTASHDAVQNTQNARISSQENEINKRKTSIEDFNGTKRDGKEESDTQTPSPESKMSDENKCSPNQSRGMSKKDTKDESQITDIEAAHQAEELTKREIKPDSKGYVEQQIDFNVVNQTTELSNEAVKETVPDDSNSSETAKHTGKGLNSGLDDHNVDKQFVTEQGTPIQIKGAAVGGCKQFASKAKAFINPSFKGDKYT